MLKKEFTITDNLVNQRLDKVLATVLSDYSRVQIQRWIAKGFITLNHQVILTPKTKTKANDHIVIRANIDTELQPMHQAEDLPLDIIFEDDALIVVNKPPGLVVHPGAGNVKHTLMNALLYHSPPLNQLPRAGIIHRLDKDTSGLLLIAKTPAAYQRLIEAIKTRAVTREYRAIVKGLMIAGGEIDAPIGRHPRARTQMAVRETGGKDAMTYYRVLEKFQAHTYLSINLDTGRTHQIRVHMMHIHYPILGDQTYGKHIHPKGRLPEKVLKIIQSFKRQALHAYKLTLKHPLTQKNLTFIAPIPKDMQLLIQALKSY